MCAEKLEKGLEPKSKKAEILLRCLWSVLPRPVEKHIKTEGAGMKLLSGLKRQSKYEDFWFILLNSSMLLFAFFIIIINGNGIVTCYLMLEPF